MISETEARDRERRAYDRGLKDADGLSHIPPVIAGKWVDISYPAIAALAVDAELGHTIGDVARDSLPTPVTRAEHNALNDDVRSVAALLVEMIDKGIVDSPRYLARLRRMVKGE